MGVYNFFKKFLIDMVGSEPYTTVDYDNIMSVLIDINGDFYDIANDVYGIGESLSGKPLKARKKEVATILDKMKTKEGMIELNILFSLKLKDMLTKNVIEKLNPSDILIIAIDGKAFRAKQKQQRSRRFKSALDKLNDDEDNKSFDTGMFSVGTYVMRQCTNIVNEWIIENSEKLPPFVYFSDTSEEGEAEHKIFNIFEYAVDRIEEAIAKDYNKTYKYVTSNNKVREVIKRGRHVVISKDSDLFFISLMRTKYNIFWLKGMNMVYKDSSYQDMYDRMVDISFMRDWISKQMGAYVDDVLDEKIYKQCLNDFVLLSFFIGDDFVPGSFCFNIHVGLALNEMFKVYRSLMPSLTTKTHNDVKINIRELLLFLNVLKEKEEEFFDIKVIVKDLEGLEERNNKQLIDIRNKLMINNPKFKFKSSEYLDLSFDNFNKEWKMNVICPNYKHLNKKQKKLLNSMKCLDDEFDDACHSFLVGLQWNLSYYSGVKKMSNWCYNWCFAPTIKQLSEYLNKTDNFEITEHIDSDREILSTSSILFSIFNINLSKRLLNKISLSIDNKAVSEKRLNENIDVEKRLNLTQTFDAYNPIEFKSFFEGCYYDSSKSIFGETVLLPFVPLETQLNISEVKGLDNANILKGEKNMMIYGLINEHVRYKVKSTKLVNMIFNRELVFSEDTKKPTKPKSETVEETKPKVKKVFNNTKQNKRNTINKPKRLRVMEETSDF